MCVWGGGGAILKGSPLASLEIHFSWTSLSCTMQYAKTKCLVSIGAQYMYKLHNTGSTYISISWDFDSVLLESSNLDLVLVFSPLSCAP